MRVLTRSIWKKLLRASVLIILPIAAANTAPVWAEENRSTVDSPLEIDVWYITLRNRTGEVSHEAFFAETRDLLRTGRCRVEFSSIWGLSDIAESAPFYIPDEKQAINKILILPEKRFWYEVAIGLQSNSGNPVLYIHGYNIGFAKGCRRAAIFQRAMGLNGRLVLFSWPADGSFLNYTRDEADLAWSVPYIQAVLEQMVALFGRRKVDVVGHSLGARGVVMALNRMACRKSTTALFDQLILIAADVDAELFRRDLATIRPLARRFSLYVSANDKALKLSHELHGYPRLGEAGEYITVVKHVDTIDISAAGNERFSGHLYHLFNPLVIKDISLLLQTGDSARNRPGLKRALSGKKPYWVLDVPEVSRE